MQYIIILDHVAIRMGESANNVNKQLNKQILSVGICSNRTGPI